MSGNKEVFVPGSIREKPDGPVTITTASRNGGSVKVTLIGDVKIRSWGGYGVTTKGV